MAARMPSRCGLVCGGENHHPGRILRGAGLVSSVTLSRGKAKLRAGRAMSGRSTARHSPRLQILALPSSSPVGATGLMRGRSPGWLIKVDADDQGAPCLGRRTARQAEQRANNKNSIASWEVLPGMTRIGELGDRALSSVICSMAEVRSAWKPSVADRYGNIQ